MQPLASNREDSYSDAFTDRAFWEAYIKGRPQVPPSFWDRIFQYHAAHNGSFGVVNDVGASVGIHSNQLARAFDRVIVTEPSLKTLQTAESLLARSADDGKKFTFVQSKAETSDQSQLPGTVDMVFACNMMHFTEPDSAISAFANQLKPGGTSDDAWRHVAEHMTDATRKAAVARGEDMDVTLRLSKNAFDAVAIPSTHFHTVQRVKLNWRRGNEFVPGTKIMHELAWESKVGAHEEAVSANDPDWSFEKDLDGLKEHAASFPITLDPAVADPLWERLAETSEGGLYKGYWPVSLILAIRK